jgi:hypothetical protein
MSIAQEVTGDVFNKKQINDLYKHLIKQGHMNKTCFISDHNRTLNDCLSFLIHPEIRMKYVGAQYLTDPKKSWGKAYGDFCIIQVKTVNGNGHFRLISYDPYFPSPEYNSILSVRYYSIV